VKYGLQIWPEHSQGPSKQKPIKIMEKGGASRGHLCDSTAFFYIQLFMYCAEHVDDSELMVDLFELIGRLSVRDEFCQKVLELGGVANILSALQNSITDKVHISIFSLSFACKYFGNFILMRFRVHSIFLDECHPFLVIFDRRFLFYC